MEDLTDNEQEERLRRWWSENWLWIVGGIVLGLALLWGWQYWQRSRLEAAQREEAAYAAVIDSLGKNQFDQAALQARAMRDEKATSPYADQADLAIARAAIESGKLDDAAQRLKGVADGSKDPELRAAATTRLARVLIEQRKFDESLALLDVASAGAFTALYHDIRGDAYAGKGDPAAARGEYQAALDAAKGDVRIDSAYIELKKSALPEAAAPVAGAPGK